MQKILTFISARLMATLATGATQSGSLPMRRVSIASTTTVYLAALSVFSTSTMQATGVIRARRVR